jgi:sterol desaturase/sphingolipid hydroxylase (fatty acid hydroxylase superfamily)
MNPFLLILLQILCYDLWFYTSHIILHYRIPYSKIHYEHHQQFYQTLIFWDAYKGNHLEGVIQSAGLFVPYLIIDITLSNLIIAGFITNLRGLMRHDNRCIWLIGNHHILHHKYPRYNYGEYWIDKLCGTLCPHTEDYIYGKIYI